MAIFDNYSLGASFDEVFDEQGKTRDCWQDILNDIEATGLDKLQEKQEEIDWHLSLIHI